MNHQLFIVGEIQTNCYLLYSSTAAGIIDPGGPVDAIVDYLEDHGLHLEWIVNTHGHFDHIIGNAELAERYGAPIYIHKADRPMLISAQANFSDRLYTPVTSPDASRILKEGDIIALAGEQLEVLETPGHTPGGISLYGDGRVYTGDALFWESIGRTDFPGGDFQQLVHGIRTKLLTLPGETQVFPGHGPSTTIAHECLRNPFLG